MDTYSKLLWAGEFPTASTVVYTVPPSTTAVIRDLEINNSAGSESGVFLTTATPGFANSLFLYAVNIAPNTPFQWQGRVVLPALSEVSIFTGLAGMYLLMSGYELG